MTAQSLFGTVVGNERDALTAKETEMETVIIDAEWEEIPPIIDYPEGNINQHNWLDLAIQIEYGYIGLCAALKVLSMMLISACE